jgi:hypothetical protein
VTVTSFEDVEADREARIFAEGDPRAAGPGEEEYRSYEREAHLVVEARTDAEADEFFRQAIAAIQGALESGSNRELGARLEVN